MNSLGKFGVRFTLALPSVSSLPYLNKIEETDSNNPPLAFYEKKIHTDPSVREEH